MGDLFRRLQYLLHRRQLDRELKNDMDFHREMMAREGRRNFGNTLRLREDAREAWGWTWIERFEQDVSYAMRTMLRSPGFTASALFVLAIGIGVNVSAFCLFNMVRCSSYRYATLLRSCNSSDAHLRTSPAKCRIRPWCFMALMRNHCQP